MSNFIGYFYKPVRENQYLWVIEFSEPEKIIEQNLQPVLKV